MGLISQLFTTFVPKRKKKVRSHGIILHSLHYGDRKVILDVFTEAAGCVSFITASKTSSQRGIRPSTWQPLALVEVVWEPHPKSSLQKPQELTLWQPWRDLSFRPLKSAVSLFLSDFLFHALRSEQQNALLFDFVVASLRWFDQAESRYSNFHIVFLLHLSRFLGFMPNVDDWQPRSYFDLQAASFVAILPHHPYYLEPDEAALVCKFFRMDYRSMRAVALNGRARRRTLDLIVLFYRLHLPEFPELKSLEVLSEVFT